MSGSARQLDQVRDAPTAPDQRRGDRPRGRLIYRRGKLAGSFERLITVIEPPFKGWSREV